MPSEWDSILDRVVSDIKRINDTYASADILIKEALQTAIPWVTAYMSGHYTPTANQLLTLGEQLIAIGIAEELSSKKRQMGFIHP